MDLRCGDRLGHYELLEKLGAGGMGVVWKARDTRLNRTIALKLLHDPRCTDPASLARFEREARALAAVNHPGIVTIYSIEQAGELHFLTMEHVPGMTLAHVVPDAGLPLWTFLDLAERIAGAVAAAHEQGVIHRDLKPSNVLVTSDGDVKILDFGIAAFLEARPRAASATAPTTTAPTGHELVGTPPYIAPEQLLGHEPDHRSDLFSLGAILYFMASGREAYSGETHAETIAAVLRDAPAPLTSISPNVPHELADVVDRCLAKRPDERFQTATELVAALQALRGTAVVADRRPARSLAVLPFDDLSPDKDQEYFCEGIAEEITLSLSKITTLRVASRSAAFFAKRTFADRRQLASHLGVETILEGSVRKAGQRLRITVELMDVSSQYQLWAERYDRELQDIFAIQDDIATRVAEALCCTITQLEHRALRQRPTPQVHAFDFYLRGRKFLYQFSRKGIEFASRMFVRALEVDPAYARAHAGLAECHAFLYLYGGRNPRELEDASAESRRSLELGPDCAEAHAARGIALSLSAGYDDASAEFEAAIRLNPDLFDVHYFYARAAFAAGRFDDAIRRWERAGALRPDDYQSPLLVAQAYEQVGRNADAAEARRRGVAIAEEHVKLYPDDVRALYMGANGLVALGRHDEGLEWARQALALDPADAMLLYNIGCIYSLAGREDEALDCLERAVTNGLAQKEWFLHDTNLDALRTHPRFVKLMASFEPVASSS